MDEDRVREIVKDLSNFIGSCVYITQEDVTIIMGYIKDLENEVL